MHGNVFSRFGHATHVCKVNREGGGHTQRQLWGLERFCRDHLSIDVSLCAVAFTRLLAYYLEKRSWGYG